MVADGSLPVSMLAPGAPLVPVESYRSQVMSVPASEPATAETNTRTAESVRPESGTNACAYQFAAALSWDVPEVAPGWGSQPHACPLRKGAAISCPTTRVELRWPFSSGRVWRSWD